MRKSKYAISIVESATDYDQREGYGPDTHPASGLGGAHRADRKANRGRAKCSATAASPSLALRSPLTLHRLDDHHQDADVEADTDDGRRTQARGYQMGGILRASMQDRKQADLPSRSVRGEVYAFV